MRTAGLSLLIVGLFSTACSDSIRVDLGSTHAGGTGGAGGATGGAGGDATGGVGAGGAAGVGAAGSGGVAGGAAGTSGSAGEPPVLDCTVISPRACDDRSFAASAQGVCDGNGWCWENPLPYGIDVSAISTAKDGDAWAVSSSHVLRFDGTTWSIARDLPKAGDSVWVSPDDSVWVSAGTVVYHLVGPTWEETDLGVDVGKLGGTSATNVWASSPGHTHHLVAGSWQHTTNPANYVASLAVVGDDELWISDDSSIYHYQAGSWSATTFPGGASIAAFDAADIWFTRGNLSKHLSGGTFTDTLLPTGKGYYKSWASPSGQLWLAAEDGRLYRWDGATLHTEPALERPLSALTGNSDADLWAVGSRGLLGHFDGSVWSKQTRIEGDALAFVTSVHGSAADDVWAVGENLTAHFDGTSWTNRPSESGGLFAVWADSRTSAFASSRNDIQHWDGANWSTLVATPYPITALQSLGDGRLWMVSVETAEFLVYRYQNGALHEYKAQVPVLPTRPALWANSDCDVWVGAEGLAHFDGENWSAVPLPGVPEFPYISSIYAPRPNDVYVVLNGELVHFDGAAWSKPYQEASELETVWGCGDVLFTQGDHSAARNDGAGWRAYPKAPLGLAPQAWSAGSGNLIFADYDGQIVRYSPPSEAQ
ncbi:MAG: hypothetical protein AB7K71_12625 [Polyangiaceae bacterium]